MADRSDQNKNEKMRLCPSCRCEISFLATKCRHCGEVVGRPKDETRNLSIDDLGGESTCHYAPSSNVMDALEAFRLEETSAPNEAPAKGRKDKAPVSQTDSDFPQLDERSRALASLSIPTRRTPVTPEIPKPSWQSRARLAGYIIVVAVFVFVVGNLVAPMVQEIFAEERPAPPDYSRAQRLLEQKSPVDALLAVAEAERKVAATEQSEVVVAARKGVAEQVRALLNADDWSDDKVSEASAIMERVIINDPSPEMRTLKEEVDRESFAYRMNLEKVSPAADTATFKLNDLSDPSLPSTGKVGDRIGARFVIREIRAEGVVLEDLERKTSEGRGRLVRYGLGLNRTPVLETSRRLR